MVGDIIWGGGGAFGISMRMRIDENGSMGFIFAGLDGAP